MLRQKNGVDLKKTLRGLKNGKILDLFQNKEGGGNKQISIKFKFRLLKTDGGGGRNFSKKSKFQIWGPYGTLGAI